jgi:hypothetical protein
MEDAQESGVIERAWAGGEAGMVVTNRVLEVVDVRLSTLANGGYDELMRRVGTDATVHTRRVLPRVDYSEQTTRDHRADAS